MDTISQIETLVSKELACLNLNFVFAGIEIPPKDVASPSGFLPVFFEQQQVLSTLIGIPENFQPAAFGTVIQDETALLDKTLQVTSKDGVVPLISYLTDAARMTKRLSVNNTVDLIKLINPDHEAPYYLSVVLNDLCDQSNPPAPDLTLDQELGSIKP